MRAAKVLQDVRVVVTRPQQQAQALLQRLREQGAQPRSVPLLAIEPLAENPVLRQCIMDLDRYHVIVCISPNAARLMLEWVDQYWPQLPLGIQWFCVGPATAQVLAGDGIDAGYPARGEPARGETSEDLLQMPELQDMAHQRVLICRGEGGREILADTLRARGAQVEYLELYRRVMPRLTPEQQAVLTGQELVDALLISSGQALTHLYHWMQSQRAWYCRDKLLIVPSERVATQAAHWGFSRVMNAGGASDPLMVEALREALDTQSASR